jgi:2'-5' RNA ligase
VTQILDHRGRPIEVRDPSAATRHVVYQQRGERMVANWDAMVAVDRGYYGTPYLARALQVRAGALAGLPLRAGADPDKPADHNPKAPILRFLRGNPLVASYWLITWAMLQRDVTGRYAFELELDRQDHPVKAWPLVSAYLDPVPTEQGSAFFERFEYRVTNDRENVRRLRAEQVHYDWRPSLSDYRQPESLLQSMRLNVSVLLALDLHNFSFLNNGGAPSHLVIHEEFALEADRDKFRNQWKSEFTGPSNAGRPMFVDHDGNGDAKGAVDVIPLGISQRDARSVETYQQEIQAISVGTGVPMSKLGDASGRTYSNAGQEDRNFWEMMVDVAAELAGGINRELAGRLGSDAVWFDFSDVEALQPKRPFRDADLSALVGKVVTVNESREAIGLPPLDDPAADQLDPRPSADDGPRATVTALPPPAASPTDDAGQDRAGQPAARRTGGPAPAEVGVRAAGSHSGAMIALVPSPGDVARLALDVPGAEPADQLHLTLAFLGDAAAWSPDARGAVRTLAASLAERPPVRAEAFGAGHWNVDTDEPSWNLQVGGEQVEAVHGLLWSLLDGTIGLPPVPDQHAPYSAHVCLAYSADPSLAAAVADRAGPLVFDRVRVAFGDDIADLPLVVDEEARARRAAADEVEARARGWRAVDRQLTTLERQWVRAWRAYFARQADATIDRLTKQRRAKPVRDALAAREVRELAPNLARVFDVTAWTRDALDFLVGLFETVATTATGRMADRFERDLDLDDRVERFIRERAEWLAETVNTTTAERISDQLVEGAEAGEGIDKLAARVRSVFAEASQTRAETIARTSVVGAYNYAAEAAADQLGGEVVAGKEWIATRPFPPDPAARTRPDHADADGQVVRMGESFRVGASRLAFPGDPSAPAEQVLRCRCAVGFLTPEEMGERSASRRVELRAALTVLDLAARGLLTDVRRAVEAAA